MTRASCQPASTLQDTLTMWSVKTFPKPGAARISASRSGDVGRGVNSVVNVSAMIRGYGSGDPTGYRVTDLLRRACRSAALSQVRRNGGLHARSRIRETERLQQHANRQHGRRGVGDSLTSDIRRAAVHRLEHRRRCAVDVEVPTRGQADAARDRRTEVGDDV